MTTAWIRLLRPSQWIKSTFVFAPLIFSGHLFDPQQSRTALIAFVSFSLMSSFIYIINDIFDRETDRLHPVKRRRPIAAGEISIPAAAAVAAVLIVASFLLAAPLPFGFVVALASYCLLEVFYSIALKQVVLLDIFCIAGGFMLRVVGGAVVIGVTMSSWIILCTMFLSLFLAVAKRRGELILFRSIGDGGGRRVLQEYDTALLDQLMTIAATGMAISYALYTVAEDTVAIHHTENLVFTTIFVLFGVFRYLYLVVRKNLGENPVSVILHDRPMLLNLALWLVVCVFIIYR